MNSYLLRVEGVNLDSFVYDTKDLSTIRGGGLLLLNAAEEVKKQLKAKGLESVSIVESASIGLFKVTTERAGEDLRREVAAALSKWLPHATFVVDFWPGDTETPEARNQVLTLNRWRQMQAPCVVYPALREVNAETDVCEIDLLRPGTQHGRDERQSDHVRHRRQHGRRQKQAFYQEEMRRAGAQHPLDLNYSQDFDGLCGDSDQWGNLRDKMALIYVDGNKFGAIGQEANTETYGRFSLGLRKAQAEILSKLINQKALHDPDWRVIDDDGNGVIRLETLLWGGDEIIWVVPAWKGWELLEFFFEQWSANPKPEWSPADHRLTFTAALVFCHQKTPIHSVRDLAHGMVNGMKNANKDDPYKNRFAYQVLESFDYVSDPKECLINQSLSADEMKTIRQAMPGWRESISRKKLYTLRKNPTSTDTVREIRQALPPASLTAFDAIGEHHITELWDYVVPEESDI